VPAVVANQYAVLDEAATVFARELYASLARGWSVGDAAREARVAVGHTTGSEALEWAVPVVFARDPRATLRATGVPARGPRARGRRASTRASGRSAPSRRTAHS